MEFQTLAVIPHEEEYCRQRISQICSAFLDSDIYDEISEELKASENIGDYPIARKQAPLSMQVYLVTLLLPAVKFSPVLRSTYLVSY